MSKITSFAIFVLLAIGLVAPGTAESIGLARKPGASGDDSMQQGQYGAGPGAGTDDKKQMEEHVQQGGSGDSSSTRERLGSAIEREQRRHLKRSAQLNRIQALGIEDEDREIVDRARVLRDREDRRHKLAMKRLMLRWRQIVAPQRAPR